VMREAISADDVREAKELVALSQYPVPASPRPPRAAHRPAAAHTHTT
jgi:hypothetical protein